MTTFEIAAALTTLAALFSWVNHRWVRLPPTIGLMIIAMISSLAIVGLTAAGVLDLGSILPALAQVDFGSFLLNGVLGALLFAGGLHVDVTELVARRWTIALLATGGVVLSTVLIGVVSWQLLAWTGVGVPLAYCLLFGAIISPTDPIAVGAILRRAGVPKTLEIEIAGESLFNDGFGVVVFLIILQMATGQDASAGRIGILFLEEVVGGLTYGALVGGVTYFMLKSIDQYEVEILLTLGLVTGGYALAQRLHVSGPLAMVVAGLLIGNHGRTFAMSARTRERLDAFWELVDDFLNAMLFVLIGLDAALLVFQRSWLLASAAAIPLVLLARWVSVGIPIALLRALRQPVSAHALKILTWSGLRGGISVALALSVPAGEHRDLIVTATYVVVAFSIIVQGLTVGPYARWLTHRGGPN